MSHAAGVLVLLAASGYAVSIFPHSILAFLLFQLSILALYLARMRPWLKTTVAVLALCVMMPAIGTINGYYLEVATQVGIFAALALGLNIVVGLAGLLDLGYVAFFAVGAYLWAIFGSPQANRVFGGGFPLAPGWFFVFLLVGLTVAAVTGVLLGLPVLRLRGDYLAIVTLGFGEILPQIARNGDNRRKSGRNHEPLPERVVETPPPAPALALSRIQMPPEAIARIGEILIPGSSLTISDQGLGRETGRYTEFVVLTR